MDQTTNPAAAVAGIENEAGLGDSGLPDSSLPQLLEQELLVEEISIDGMCGVY